MKIYSLLIPALLFTQGASASLIVFTANLAGVNESPANASPGTGFATVSIDDVTNQMEVDVSFSGLLGTTSASHIHCCTTTAGSGNIGVATVTPSFTGFPTGVTSGAYDHFFDLTQTASFNAAFVTANGGTAASAEAALIAGMLDGRAYLNIHSSVFPGGEIRGFLTLTEPTPEPGTILLASSVLAGLVALRRRAVR